MEQKDKRIAELEGTLIWLYNQGYHAGHHDTVESVFIDLMPVDMETYHDDVVADLMEGRGIVDWAKGQLLAGDT